MKRFLFAVVISLLAVSQIQASRIATVTASTPDMGAGFGTILANTVNGTGLASLTLTATHAATIPANSWVSGGTLTGHIIFDLGSAFPVDSFSFWNQNGGGPGVAGSTGIQGVAVSTSLDGISYAALAGGPTQFSQVAGTVAGPEIFNFSAVSARFFQFTVSSNWGDSAETGFAEVGFNSAVVPEPATLSLTTLGALALALRFLARRFRTV
jgi:hypothetical protein